MSSIRETAEHLKRSLSGSDGFISTYFLVTMLFVISFVTMIAYCDRIEMLTMMNLETAQDYFRSEICVINELRCMIAAAEGDETSFASSLFSASVNGTQITVQVYGACPETLVLTYDPGSRMILDYDAFRDAEEFREDGG